MYIYIYIPHSYILWIISALDDQDNFDNLFSDSRPRELVNYVEKRLDFTRHHSIHKSKLLPVLEDCVITLKELDLGQR